MQPMYDSYGRDSLSGESKRLRLPISVIGTPRDPRSECGPASILRESAMGTPDRAACPRADPPNASPGRRRQRLRQGFTSSRGRFHQGTEAVDQLRLGEVAGLGDEVGW